MEIIHVTAECYPMAKAGGLADVAGALPKYQNKIGHNAKVVMPMHRTKFLYNNQWQVAHKGTIVMGENNYEYTIIKEQSDKLGFNLFCVDINGLLDREMIYGYDDDTERFVAFQIAVLDWIGNWQHQPDIIHVHDHHAGLIPFMLKFSYAYQHIANIPCVLTIHNAQYQGWLNWDKVGYLPAWDTWRWGLLEWNNVINPLAAAIKCADLVTTVSPGYMQELMQEANGLESLFRAEAHKCHGVINGIDFEVWNPATDTYIAHNFSAKKVTAGKQFNKEMLCKQFDFNPHLPLFIFIGRLVEEKAADLLPELLIQTFARARGKFSFLILGSGEKHIEHQLTNLNSRWVGYYNSRMEYNEKLSHQMYASADFLLMPSRVEPCGLNQLYAMRYGTVPVVRRIGGLKDTVLDYGDEGGYGICFDYPNIEDMLHAFDRALALYEDETSLKEIRGIMMNLKTSWEVSAKQYIDLYQTIKTQTA